MPETPHPTDEPIDADLGRYVLLFGLLVVSILILGLLGPGSIDGTTPRFTNVVITALTGGVLLAALRISGARQSHQRFYLVAVITVLAMLIGIILLGSDSAVRDWLGIIWILLVVATPFIVLRRVIMARNVTLQTIIGAVCVFLLIGISFAYVVVAIDSHTAFFAQEIESTDYIYFAFVTITSLGFGDLSPVGDFARTTTIVFTVIGQLYLVMIFAKLVSVWSPTRRTDS